MVQKIARGVLVLLGAFAVVYIIYSIIAGPEQLPEFLQPPTMPWER